MGFHSGPAALLVLVLSSWNTAAAGPNVDGTLILHANPALSYTTDATSYCGQSNLSECYLALATTPANPTAPTVFHALAAFPDDSSPSVKGVTFGVDYDQAAFTLVDWGHCANFELATASWPLPQSGTALTWNSPKTNRLFDAYWFAGYSTGLTPTTFELSLHPTQGATFADDATPSNLDEVAAFGTLGFNIPGSIPCPGGAGTEGVVKAVAP